MSSIPWLDASDYAFPATENALSDPNGLLAVGGDLSPQRLIEAYRQGIFPWYDESQPILWWSPNPRVVLFPDRLHLSRSLKKRLNKQEYIVTFDRAFTQVIQHCALIPRADQAGTWITHDMLNAYIRLHEMGVAHSVESWCDGELVGGLYGVSLGKLFFGESMFSLRTDASKVAFVHLCNQLNDWGFPMIDCQIGNPHLSSLGLKPSAELNSTL